MLEVVVRRPGEVGEVEIERAVCLGELLEDADARADDFGADAVGGDGGDAVGWVGLGSCWGRGDGSGGCHCCGMLPLN